MQNIKNKAFLDRLPHTVNMEGMKTAVLVLCSKHFKSSSLRCGGERKEAQVLVSAVGDQLAYELVLRIDFFLGFAFDLRILAQRVLGVGEGGF